MKIFKVIFYTSVTYKDTIYLVSEDFDNAYLLAKNVLKESKHFNSIYAIEEFSNCFIKKNI